MRLIFKVMHASSQAEHHCENLIHLFDECFLSQWNTRLIGGAPEPIYLPADAHSSRHRVHFTRDYFASALHEVAHWCIAGDRRRSMVDYGYWYAPDGRDAAQQSAFEQVEVKPQALEWIFSEACGARFRVSADNLSAGVGASATFAENIAKQARAFCIKGLAERPGRFVSAVAHHYGVTDVLNPDRYQLHLIA